MRYSPELLDRVADAMDSRSQQYWSTVGTRSDTGKFCYCVGYYETLPDGSRGEYVTLLECDTREESIDARDVLEMRARAAAALMAVDYEPPREG